MLELSKTVSASQIWESTLAPRVNDEHSKERERLRTSFEDFRARAAHLATEISRDMPDLTVHDITHLDSLWQVASTVVGSKFKITPTEGYVLGGAILLHDLAMSVAATPGGFESLKRDRRWRDIVWAVHRDLKLDSPTEKDFESPQEFVRKRALFDILRLLHAENAAKLAFTSFGESEKYFLIEDTGLRQTFGRIIGEVAHSHWWSVEDVQYRFNQVIGAPHWAPENWTINPLKIACILRAADAAHIDARRAPTFVKAFSKFGTVSKLHWDFQERLNKPYLNDDALVFTSGNSFDLNQAGSWWLCFDTLKMIDKELRSIDSLFSDKSMPRFDARRVAGVDNPERMSEYIHATNWQPINATVHISDLPNIIRSLGGEQLYGKDPRIPLRELLQNAADAIRARIFNEGRSSDFGEIRVSIVEDDNAWSLVVEDNGVGMSERVLTEYLLDFGSSFWSKAQVQEEFPGLISSGFKSTGRYGIGFFSVFMVADRVTVITRRPDSAAKDTLILEFGCGLSGRPILRQAHRDEQLRDGGTRILLQLKRSPGSEGGLLYAGEGKESVNLIELCQKIAPALDAKVVVSGKEGSYKAVEANDWLTIPGEDLIARLHDEEELITAKTKDFLKRASSNLRCLTDSEGRVLGRCCMTAGHFSYKSNQPKLHGCITVGGFLAAKTSGVCGLLVGDTSNAARDTAIPSAPEAVLAQWATEQSSLVPLLYESEEDQAAAAQYIRVCGGSTEDLPIAIFRGAWISANEIKRTPMPQEIVIISHFTLDYELKYAKDLRLNDNVFVTNSSGIPVPFEFDGIRYESGSMPSLAGAIIEAIAIPWQISISEIKESNDLERKRKVFVGHYSEGEVHVDAIVLSAPRRSTETLA